MAKKTVNDLSSALAERIKKLGPAVEESLIEARKERELNKRVSALDSVWEQMERMVSERRRCKPDMVSYGPDNEDGTTGPEIKQWSAAAIKARKELDEKIAKFEKAINLALGGDFGEVYNLSKAKSGDTKSSDGN